MRKTLPVLILAAMPLLAQPDEMLWVGVTDSRLEINGLPWQAENGAELIRFPLRLKDALPKAVWGLAQSPSGGRIRIRTDAKKLAVRLEYPSPPSMRNMHAFGQTGVDLYLGDSYRGTATAPNDAKAGTPVEHAYFDLKDQPRIERDITLYLPLYKPVKVLAVGVDREARLAKPKPFSLPRPVVFYGTSITQGGCASRAGMSYQAILGRALNIDFVNLGFSGNGKGEPEVARAVAEIPAACFVLDFAQNNRTVDSLREVYDPFVAVLREKHAETPIVAITPIANAGEQIPGSGSQTEGMRQLIRHVVSQRIARGDQRLQLVEGTDLLGPDRLDGLVDGSHPNDLGFQWMADGLAPRLGKVLGISARVR
jgi:hypothetical protein